MWCYLPIPFTGNIKHNEQFLFNLNKCIGNINKNHKCIITGDLNYDLADHKNTNVTKITGLMFDNLYFPVINKPTRICKSSATVLNHIRTNLHSLPIKSGIILRPLSDHMPAYMSINFKLPPKKQTNLIRSFTKDNICKFNQNLASFETNDIINEPDPNKAFDLLTVNYGNAFNQHFPLKSTKKFKVSHSWFDHELYELMRNKDKLYKKFICQKSSFAKAQYNRARNTYFHTLKKKK